MRRLCGFVRNRNGACIQALAHLKTALRWDVMQGTRDTEDILMMGEEKVYDFVKACIRSVSETFRSRRVHLGMDEALSLIHI